MSKNYRTMRILAGAAIALPLSALNPVSARGQAVQTEFSGSSVHVAWLAQPAPEVLPSGNMKIDGWEHLWYDDADDDRLDGYDTVVIQGVLDSDFNVINAHGTFTLREKLDDYTFEDFLDGEFDPAQVVLGDVLFAGTFTITPQQGVHGVAMNNEGLKATYSFPDPFAFPVLPFDVRLLDPQGSAIAVPEPSAGFLVCSGILFVSGGFRSRYRKSRGWHRQSAGVGASTR